MFERFFERYPVTSEPVGRTWRDHVLVETSGYVEVMQQAAGLTMGGGLLRFVTDSDGPIAQEAIRTQFPQFAARAVPFARDWLGRHLAVDRGRSDGSSFQLLLLEPGSGEAFEIDEDLEHFLDVDLVADPETFLESRLFELWRDGGGAAPGPEQCVGFKVPLFLGGAGSVDNLELSDAEVYWDLCSQMWNAVKGLRPGTTVRRVELR